MEFGFDNGPHLKDHDHTAKIMKRLLIALMPVVLFAIYKNGILPYMEGYTDILGAIWPLIMILTAMFTSLLVEVIYIRFILKKKETFKNSLRESYAMFPGLFLALTLPINTPLWLIVLGSMVATFIGKLLFGGFGYNVFNPALVGSIFVISSYGALIGANGGYLNPMEVDTIAGATPLSHLSTLDYLGTWTSIVKPFGSIWDMFFGFIPGSLGETSKLLIILAFIYLAATKVIKWVVPVSYVSVVFIMTYIIGAYNNQEIWYSLFHVLSGGLLFGAVFMATDPVTSPTTKMGQFLFGLSLGLLTVTFRFLTPYPEGVLTSILTMNMLVFILDRIGAKAKFKSSYKYSSAVIMITLIVLMSIYIGNDIKGNKETVDTKFKIIDVKESGSKTTYEVTQQGFKSIIKATVVVENGNIISIDVTSQDESYWVEMQNQNYLSRLIEGQKKLDEVDVVSGATISSNAFKSMVEKILIDYEARQ